MTTTDRDPGLPPSVCGPGITTCEARTRLWRHGVLEAEGFPVADISRHLAEEGTIVWLDLMEPSPEDFLIITDEFDLHPLAVRDALTARQRSKVDRYDDHVFVSLYDVALSDVSGELTSTEIAAFLTQRALITVHKEPGFDIDELIARWDGDRDLMLHGVSSLVYALLDQVVDGYFVAVQVLDEGLEGIEDRLFDDVPHDREVQRRSFEMRKSLVLLRRVVLPMREVLNAFMRRDLQIVPQEMQPYYQDVYDHVLRASEWTESLRDLVTTILETSLTIQSNRLNDIMKKLTAWAAIIAVPTAITGFYGQNLRFPGVGTTWGFVASVVLIFGMSGGLYLGFKRREWI